MKRTVETQTRIENVRACGAFINEHVIGNQELFDTLYKNYEDYNSGNDDEWFEHWDEAETTSPNIFRNIQFTNVVMAGHTFEGSDYDMVVFMWCAFDNVNLSGCKFKHVKFEHCYFNHCNLTRTIFENCTFQYTHFDDECNGNECAFGTCDMEFVHFADSRFYDTSFDRSLISASLFRNVDLRKSAFAEVTFDEPITRLKHCNMIGCTMVDVKGIFNIADGDCTYIDPDDHGNKGDLGDIIVNSKDRFNYKMHKNLKKNEQSEIARLIIKHD